MVPGPRTARERRLQWFLDRLCAAVPPVGRVPAPAIFLGSGKHEMLLLLRPRRGRDPTFETVMAGTWTSPAAFVWSSEGPCSRLFAGSSASDGRAGRAYRWRRNRGRAAEAQTSTSDSLLFPVPDPRACPPRCGDEPLRRAAVCHRGPLRRPADRAFRPASGPSVTIGSRAAV